MKKFIIGVVLFLLVGGVILFLIIGNRKSIIGKWKVSNSDDELYYIFNKDKTCAYEMSFARLDCTYKDDGKKITILYKGKDKSVNYEYKLDDDKLIIKDDTGKEIIFIKQKKK